MATLPIDEVDVLKILELTWSYMIDQLTTHCRQQLSALYCIREYLDQSGFTVA